MRRSLALLLVLALASGCALIPPSHPDLAYYPSRRDPATTRISRTLHRAAEATFYFSDGLARLPQRHIDALVAQKVAHEILGHAGKRRTLSLSMTAGFAVLGLFMPGFGLADFVVNPLVVRAYSREQELAADQRTIEILRDMGHGAPRRTLAGALRAAAAVNPPASPFFEQRLLAHEPDLEDRLAALEPFEPTVAVAMRRAATRR